MSNQGVATEAIIRCRDLRLRHKVSLGGSCIDSTRTGRELLSLVRPNCSFPTPSWSDASVLWPTATTCRRSYCRRHQKIRLHCTCLCLRKGVPRHAPRRSYLGAHGEDRAAIRRGSRSRPKAQETRSAMQHTQAGSRYELICCVRPAVAWRGDSLMLLGRQRTGASWDGVVLHVVSEDGRIQGRLM